jgi:GntR family transcriptional repressor for pyruvate dehydrogenase complex
MPSDSLAIRVTDYIFNYIRDNELSAGETLPSELRTSTELNISRGMVREAFCSLEVAGIIAKERGRSPKVGALNSGFLTHLMLHAISTKQISARQILELRSPIEVFAAELAARKRTRSHIQQLRSAALGMRSAINNGKSATFVQQDLDFHDLINRASGNPLIELICEAMHESMHESMRVGLSQRKDRDGILKIIDTHDAIVTAIEEGNPGVAGALMKKHFDDALTGSYGSRTE